MAPTPGKLAPAFTLQADDGSRLALKDLRGKRVVLYFYPKDDTEGCTKEACEFRDAFPKFNKARAVILGVSPDSVESHAKFKAKYGLPFRLLADPGAKVATAYGVWGKKKLYGREFEGIIRTTFLIDEAGKLTHVVPVPRVAGHAAKIEELLAGAPKSR